MKVYPKEKIRNVVLLGHGSSGKTTLTEAILFNQGLTSRMGRVEDGNTVSDYTKEEIARKFSIGTGLIPIEWKDNKINLLDTPGYFDFVGETTGALHVADCAVIFLDALSGVEVGTEKAWAAASKMNIPRMLFINKMDKENIEYAELISKVKETFGQKIVPFAVPIGDGEEFKGFVDVVDMVARLYDGKKYSEGAVPQELMDDVESIRETLVESVAESDEELLEKYFEGEEFTPDEMTQGLRAGVLSGEIVPLIVGSAVNGVGVQNLMDLLVKYFPSPDEFRPVAKGVKPFSEEELERKMDADEPFSAIVFKTIVDPFVGKISLMKILSGTLKKDMEVYNPQKDSSERVGGVFLLRGKKQIDVSELKAGDIGAVAKLSDTQSGDTLCEKGKSIQYPAITFPSPGLFKAIEPKAKGDEDKIGGALTRLNEEDPSFTVTRNRETNQMILGGQGTMQLAIIANRLKEIYDVDVEVVPMKIAYRETIKGTSTVQGRHKKQTGGAGQYGDVHIRFEPSEEHFVFAEEVFGGAVPRNYFPAVEKGLEEAMVQGPLAGYQVVNIKATLLDGSYHAVDSSEMAFKIAAGLAFKKGLPEADPILLEPVMRLEIVIPDDYMGDIMGDLNKRRGRILGMEPAENGHQKVIAEAPEAELFSYSSDLRSMTQARGEFTVRFERYEEVPASIAEKVIAQSQEEN
ncbi:MAG: elongation factor G [Tissierellia bacterium]|nr:elongation factor G [Bacillota bacterium]NLL22600.1 elongation factor G [Tissierellia bacterium]